MTFVKSDGAFMLFIPYLPRGFGLADKHLVAILGGGSVLAALAEELRLSRIVDEVEEQVVGGEQMVRDGRTLVDFGESAEGRTVDDDHILVHHLSIEIIISDDG